MQIPIDTVDVHYDADEQLVACCKALASPVRVAMVRIIHAAAEPVCACDIEERFALSQPTISHHLRTLREAGIITATNRGTNTYYHIQADAFSALACCFEQFGAPKGASDDRQ